MRTPEAIEKDLIKDYLKGLGPRTCYWFMPVQTGWGRQTVDILACIHGTFWAIEVKQDGKAPTARQTAVLSQVRAAGGMTTWGTAVQIVAAIEQWSKEKGYLDSRPES